VFDVFILLTGIASVEFFDVAGNLVSNACTKAVGERMEQ